MVYTVLLSCVFFFFKQKTAYEMRISDWSSDVCSSDLAGVDRFAVDRHRQRLADADILQRVLALHIRNADRLIAVAVEMDVDQPVGHRSDERRVGKECGSKCRSRW